MLKAVVYGICHEDTTREQANQALSRFKDEFFDWNEVRVSSVEEIQETLAGIPEPEGRAQRIRRFLRQLFKRTYGFNLDLAKKPLKEALKVLQTYEAFASDYVTATVIQQALGGHAIPIDESTRRALERLGISEPDLPALRAVLERAVPKNRGAEFLDLIEDLAHDTCVEGTRTAPGASCARSAPTPWRRSTRRRCRGRQAGREAGREARRRAAQAQASKKPAKEPAKPSRQGAARRQPPAPRQEARGQAAPAPAPKSPPGKRGTGK